MFDLNCDNCGGDNLMDGPLCGACAARFSYRYRGGGGFLTPAGCPNDYADESHLVTLTAEQIAARDAADAEYGLLVCATCHDSGVMFCDPMGGPGEPCSECAKGGRLAVDEAFEQAMKYERAADEMRVSPEDALDIALIGEDTAQLDTEIWYNEQEAA